MGLKIKNKRNNVDSAKQLILKCLRLRENELLSIVEDLRERDIIPEESISIVLTEYSDIGDLIESINKGEHVIINDTEEDYIEDNYEIKHNKTDRIDEDQRWFFYSRPKSIAFTRKPSEWFEVEEIIPISVISKAPHKLNTYNFEGKTPFDEFDKNKIPYQYFIAKVGKDKYLVDTQGYDYVRYAAKIV